MDIPVTIQDDIELLKRIIRKALLYIEKHLDHEQSMDDLLGKMSLPSALEGLGELLIELARLDIGVPVNDSCQSEVVSDADRALLQAFFRRARKIKDTPEALPPA